MKQFNAIFGLAIATLAACGGGGGGSNTPDGGGGSGSGNPDANNGAALCGTPVTTLSTYPATYSGANINSGSDFNTTEGECATEEGWYDDVGPDQSIELTGLTPGAAYSVTLTTEEDLSFYIATSCDSDGPAAGACLLHVDASLGNEVSSFVAPAGGRVALIIDVPADVNLVSGEYALEVKELECTEDTQKADCTDPNAPLCVNGECVECGSMFDCTQAAEPTCQAGSCAAGPALCTGDDASEPNDGPAAATTFAMPTAQTPTVFNGMVCSSPADEADWFKIAVTSASLKLDLAWTGSGRDLDLYLLDSTGAVVDQANAASTTGPETIVAAGLEAGDYYVVALQYEPADTAAAAGYTLTASIPECTGLGIGQCTTTAEPQCSAGNCVAGPAQCTGDDAQDTGNTQNDGPGAPTAIAVPGTATNSICDLPSGALQEWDWYSFTLGATDTVAVNLAWQAAANDLDVYVLNSTGTVVASGATESTTSPETATGTDLPAGTYYIVVLKFTATGAQPAAPAIAYTLTTTLP